MLKEEKPFKQENFEGKHAASIFLQAVFMPIFIQIVFVFSLTAFLGTETERYIEENPWVYWFLNALVQLSFLTVFFRFCYKKNINSVTAAKINKRVTPRGVLITAGIAAAAVFAFDPLVLLFDAVLNSLGYTPADLPIELDTWGQYLLAVALVCVLPAVCEEIVFRGAVTGGLENYGKKTAVLLSGLCFSLMHQNPSQTVHQFLFGCLLAWMFLEGGGLLYPVLAHFFNNFIICTLQFAMNKTGTDFFAWAAGDSFGETFLISVGVSVVACTALYALLAALKKNVAQEPPSPAKEEEKIPVPVFKMPFADVLTPGGRGDAEQIKTVEAVYKKEVEVWQREGKARERAAVFASFAFGLGFCFIMWIIVFFS